MRQDWIIDEINKRGWTQRELGRRAGLPQSTLSEVINGKRRMMPKVCEALAEAFGETPERIMRLAGIIPPLPDNDPALTELTDLARRLPPDDLQEIIALIRFKLSRR